jgi:competence protein ComEA
MRTRIVRSAAATGLAAALLAGMLGTVLADPATPPSPQTRLVGVVNLNTATGEELQLLPGIGPARARAVIEYRKAEGPFKRVEDLTQVSGIGERALERIRPHCVLKGKTTANLER